MAVYFFFVLCLGGLKIIETVGNPCIPKKTVVTTEECEEYLLSHFQLSKHDVWGSYDASSGDCQIIFDIESIAVVLPGITCTSSRSFPGFVCDKVFDGSMRDGPATCWTAAQGTLPNVQIFLPRAYTVHALITTLRRGAGDRPKTVQISMDDVPFQNYTHGYVATQRTENPGPTQHIVLKVPVSVQKIELSVLSAWGVFSRIGYCEITICGKA